MAEDVHTGGCLCGAVRITASGAPNWVAHCHCATCRRASGGPFATFAGFAREAVEIAGEAYRRFPSSPGVRRGFCRKCGASISYESERWPGEVHILVGVMDAPGDFVPQAHVFSSAKLSWLHLEDGLPTFDEFPSSNPKEDAT